MVYDSVAVTFCGYDIIPKTTSAQKGLLCLPFYPPPLPPELSSGDQVFRCLSLRGPFLVQITTSRCATRTQFTELLAWRLWVPFKTMWQCLLFLSSEFKTAQCLCLLETLCRRRGEIGRTFHQQTILSHAGPGSKSNQSGRTMSLSPCPLVRGLKNIISARRIVST